MCPVVVAVKRTLLNDATPVTLVEARRLSIVTVLPDVVTSCDAPPDTTV